MSTFSEQIEINATPERVWEVLADTGDIARWNPGVQKSWVTSNTAEGVGASRRCELDGRNYLLEDVVEWNPQRSLPMHVTETNMPFKRADIRFTLEERGPSTVVTVSPEYMLKFGVLGAVLDCLFVRRTYTKGMQALLAGLKRQVEQS